MAGRREKATRVVVNKEKFRELLKAKGVNRIEDVLEMGRLQNKPISLSTLYQILNNGNYMRDSLEKLGEITGLDLHDFVTFEHQRS